jgi:hypothetical protein
LTTHRTFRFPSTSTRRRIVPGLSSSGVAIASGMVTAAAGNSVVAYRPL